MTILNPDLSRKRRPVGPRYRYHIRASSGLGLPDLNYDTDEIPPDLALQYGIVDIQRLDPLEYRAQ